MTVSRTCMQATAFDSQYVLSIFLQRPQRHYHVKVFADLLDINFYFCCRRMFRRSRPHHNLTVAKTTSNSVLEIYKRIPCPISCKKKGSNEFAPIPCQNQSRLRVIALTRSICRDIAFLNERLARSYPNARFPNCGDLRYHRRQKVSAHAAANLKAR